MGMLKIHVYSDVNTVNQIFNSKICILLSIISSHNLQIDSRCAKRWYNYYCIFTLQEEEYERK